MPIDHLEPACLGASQNGIDDGAGEVDGVLVASGVLEQAVGWEVISEAKQLLDVGIAGTGREVGVRRWPRLAGGGLLCCLHWRCKRQVAKLGSDCLLLLRHHVARVFR